jgi:hypothetical protein
MRGRKIGIAGLLGFLYQSNPATVDGWNMLNGGATCTGVLTSSFVATGYTGNRSNENSGDAD